MKKPPQKNPRPPVQRLPEKKFSYTPFLWIILGVVVFCFCFSLFKNISYPLLWNDEGEGAEHAEGILKYGYPKVHDGQNYVFMSFALLKDDKGKLLGYNEKDDAYTYLPWGSYYWTAIGAFLAKFTNDIYFKTAILRCTFALAGLLGLLFFVFSARKLFDNIDKYKWFIILFVFVELFSTSLILHLREARYFSLVILCCGCFFYIYARYYLFKTMSNTAYYVWLTVLLFLTFQVNVVTFGIFAAVLAFNRLIVFLVNILVEKRKFISEFISELKHAIPVIISIVLIYPFMVYFQVLKTSSAMSAYYKFSIDTYWKNVAIVVKYLANLEFLYTFLLVKTIWLITRWYFSSVNNTVNIKKLAPVKLMEKFSLFATSFFVIYILMIARIPSHPFVRYYIVLQPVMVLIMMIDIFLIFSQISLLEKKSFSLGKYFCIFLLFISFFLNARDKIGYMRGHFYEITHQYKGVLDYIIPYIQLNYKNPEKLVIATNYEEFCYMYYLGSKVTIGYIDNNIEDDLKYVPDIIIYRKTWNTDTKYFNELSKLADSKNIKYQAVSFPVADYSVNNIPELDFVIKHHFKTMYTDIENQKVDIYVRVK